LAPVSAATVGQVQVRLLVESYQAIMVQKTTVFQWVKLDSFGQWEDNDRT
jgi:hypothetical protein